MIEHLPLPKGAGGNTAPDPTQFCWFIHDVCESLGERFALFDEDGGRIEALCFRPDLSATPGFEAALHHGIRELASVSPFAAARVRISDRESADLTTTILADVPDGIRVSEMIEASATGEAVDPTTAIALGCEILVATSTLSPMVHGALAAERLVMTPTRRIAILDCGMAAALRTIPNTRARLWSELAIPMPPGAWSSPPFTVRSDAMQASIVVLELLLGRRLDTREFPNALQTLGREAAERASSIMPAAGLGDWFDRALSISPASFRDAADAFEALVRCPGCPSSETRRTALGVLATAWRLRGAERDEPELEPEANDIPQVRQDETSQVGHNEIPQVKQNQIAQARQEVLEPVWTPSSSSPASDRVFSGIAENETEMETAAPALWPKVAGAAAVLGLVLAGGIMALRGSQSAPTPTPVAAPAPVEGRSEPARSTQPSAAGTVADRPAPPPAPAPAMPPAVAPITLPPTATPPVATAPASDRTPRTKPVVPTRPAAPPPPLRAAAAGRNAAPVALSGIANFNAIPWANVSIDGSPRGQTPLGNVTLPVGTHDVIFSHPELGTLRRSITVTADKPTRLSVTLGAQP
jgi:hypothetical protein